jgi:hypothetical protein
MSDEIQRTEVILDAKDAQVSSSGRVAIYSWENSIESLKIKCWSLPIHTGEVISGGIHVHGGYFVYMTDSYPRDAMQWYVCSYNASLATVQVTVYALALV